MPEKLSPRADHLPFSEIALLRKDASSRRMSYAVRYLMLSHSDFFPSSHISHLLTFILSYLFPASRSCSICPAATTRPPKNATITHRCHPRPSGGRQGGRFHPRDQPPPTAEARGRRKGQDFMGPVWAARRSGQRCGRTWGPIAGVDGQFWKKRHIAMKTIRNSSKIKDSCILSHQMAFSVAIAG
jgi:hypothetical protein